MDKYKVSKIAGLIGALLSGGALIMTGQTAEGVGIIAASISSITAFGRS